MNTAAYLPIAADRVGACVRTIFFRGLDLSSVDLALEARLYPETPGAPNVGLGRTTVANAEGIRVAEVTYDAGLPITQVVLRINETTMEDANAFPYVGELGTPSVLYYDLIGIFGQDKRRLCYGELIALPTVYGMSAAPAGRAPGYDRQSSSATSWTAATLTFSDGATIVEIDGADLVGAELSKVEGYAERAEVAAARADGIADAVNIEPCVGGWQNVTLDAVGRVLAGYHPVLGDFSGQRAALVASINSIDARLTQVEENGGGSGAGETIPRVGGWITATVDQDGRVVAGDHALLGTFPADDDSSGDLKRVLRLAALKRLRYGATTEVLAAASRPVITISAPNAFNMTTSFADIGKSDPRLTYARARVAQKPGNYPAELHVTGQSVNYGDQTIANVFSVRFMTDAPKFELSMGGYAAPVTIFVDGQPLSRFPTVRLPNDGNGYGIQVDFGADTQTITPNAAVAAGGSGYAPGDILTPAGGTGAAAQLVVTRVNSGAVVAIAILSPGAYTALPGAGAATTTSGGGTGATVTLTASHNSGHTNRCMRRIEVMMGNASFRGIRIAANDLVRGWPITGPRLLVFGDSYVEGSFADYPGGVYAHRIGHRLGIEDVWQSGVGSTGFLAAPSPKVTYRTRIPDITAFGPTDSTAPYLVLVQGSINDGTQTAAALQAEVTAFWSALFQTLPDAFLVQTGILRAPGNNPADSLSAAVKAGFLAAQTANDPTGVRSGFIETRGLGYDMMTVGGRAGATTGTGSTDFYIGDDGAHPTQAGHDMIGDAWALDLLSLIRTWTI